MQVNDNNSDPWKKILVLTGYIPSLDEEFAKSKSVLFWQNNRWSKLRGRPGFRLRQVNILYPQTVRYNQRTITVMDRDGNVVSTYENIIQKVLYQIFISAGFQI